MLKIFIGRVLIAIPVLIVVASLTFFLIRMAPGGPFDSEREPGDALVEENLKAVYNLDAPLYEQYFDYMSGVFRGDFGPSFVYPRETVTDLIFSGLPVTFELALYALCFAIFLGIFSGIIAALNRNTFIDYFSMSIAMIGICVPTFLMGPALSLVFGINLGFLPVAGWGEEAGDKILPSITLGFAYAAYIARLSRGGMLEVLEQDYIRTARSKGLSEFRIIVRHAMQGGLLPVVSFMGPAIAGLLAGSFVVETIFAIPGLGRFYVDAAFNRDYTMILGTTIFFSSMIVFFNLISDLVILMLNPKAREDL